MHQTKLNLRLGQRQPGDHLADMTEFGFVLPQKLAAGGGIEKDIADLDGCAPGNPHRPGAFYRAGLGVNLPPLLGLPEPALKFHP